MFTYLCIYQVCNDRSRVSGLFHESVLQQFEVVSSRLDKSMHLVNITDLGGLYRRELESTAPKKG